MSEKLNELIEAVRKNRKYSVWTKEQNIESYSKELLDEAKEVILSIENNDLENLKEELGDVLWDALIMMAICEEKYGISIDSAIGSVIDKFKRRKPHVFQEKIVSLDEEKRVWKAEKEKEKKEKESKKVIRINNDAEKNGMIFINTDGGSRGNPGLAAIGIIIRDKNDKIIELYKEKIGVTTNNVAEYKAIIKALNLAKNYTNNEIILSSDSEVVVRQITGKYKISKDHLKVLFDEVKKEEKNFSKVGYNHVFREDLYQSKADALVNQALDER